MSSWILLTLSLLAAQPPPSAPAPSEGRAKKPAPERPKRKAPTITLPSLGEVPKAEGVQRSSSATLDPASRSAANEAQYQVIAVTHAKTFSDSPGGAQPIPKALDVVKLRDEQQTEKFATAVRVRCPERQSAEIELAILDPRGTTALSASGALSYRGTRSDEAEWIVDWEPSKVIGPGKYQVLVRVAGRPMGTWPLTIAAD